MHAYMHNGICVHACGVRISVHLCLREFESVFMYLGASIVSMYVCTRRVYGGKAVCVMWVFVHLCARWYMMVSVCLCTCGMCT